MMVVTAMSLVGTAMAGLDKQEGTATHEVPTVSIEQTESIPLAIEENDLATYAAKRFAEVSIEPKVFLSPNAKALNFTVSFIGKDLPEIKKNFVEKNWLSVMKIIDPACAGLVSKEAVDSVVKELKKRVFQAMVKIDPASVPKQSEQTGHKAAEKTVNTLLFCSRLPSLDDPDADWDSYIAGGSQCWQVNPDGTGLLQPWKPTEKEILLLVNLDAPNVIGVHNGNYRFDQKVIIDQFRRDNAGITCKQDSGDLSEVGAATARRSLRIRTRAALLALLNKF